MLKQWMGFLVVLALAAPLAAGSVALTDGSSISGELTQLENGDIKVKNAAGEVTVAKDKIASVIQDGSPTSTPAGDDSYIREVEARRKAYGNQDGLPRTVNLQSNQLMLTIGQLNYTGDAFSSTASDLSGISYGLAYARSFSDMAAMEYWGDYSYASKDYTVAGNTTTLKLQRYNLGVGPKIQKAIQLGRVESNLVLLPNIGLSAVWSSANAAASGVGVTGASFNSSSIGAALSAGLDFQFGGALLAIKARYLLTTDVSGTAGLKSTNTSAWMPQIGVGYSF